MGFIGWIFYIILGIIYFIVLSFIEKKYEITKIQKLIMSLILMLVVSGFCFRIGINYTSDIFLAFIFLMIIDIIYNSYFIERDFFDKNEQNIKYYIILVIIGFIINQEFINQVNLVFLTGEDLRIILWSFVFIFMYSFFKEKSIFSNVTFNREKFMSSNSVVVSYAKLKYKYHDICNYSKKDIDNLMYTIMIFENSKRSKLLRRYDYFMFRLNGNKRKLGIMQVESGKFITDSESIEIVHKRIEKLYTGKSKNKCYEVLKSYNKNDYEYLKYIFDIIKKI
ncbi:MAG: hypothetical protein IJI22_03500 [Bacilli bacterium]|nr:hypothetical protein [Bacilli bacterium]